MPRTQTEIKEPVVPPVSNDAKRKACLTLVNGQLTYFINRNNRRDLLWTFWFNCAESPYYADSSIETDFYPTLTRRANWVEYSETTVLKEEDRASRAQDYPLGYRVVYGNFDTIYRLDFYVTKAEFKEAFLSLQSLGRKPRDGSLPPTEIVIFGNVRVVLLDDGQFGRVEYPLAGSDPMTRLPLKP